MASCVNRLHLVLTTSSSSVEFIWRSIGTYARYGLGDVVESPVDVILDRTHALVVQPDIVFVSKDRREICADRIWGVPDLVVEVLSTFRRRHDRVTKVRWYRHYEVRECWIVDPVARTIEVLQLTSSAARTFQGPQLVRSGVLPRLRMRVDTAFGHRTA